MALITILFILIASAALTALWAFPRSVNKDKNPKNVDRIRSLKDLATRSEVASALVKLISEDGAGDWPPRVTHYSLPACFQPYQDIYLELIPTLSTSTPTLDDAVNKERMVEFRGSMTRLLAERINISEVKAALARFESGDHSSLTREAYNAVYCCIAVSRHAYRLVSSQTHFISH